MRAPVLSHKRIDVGLLLKLTINSKSDPMTYGPTYVPERNDILATEPSNLYIWSTTKYYDCSSPMRSSAVPLYYINEISRWPIVHKTLVNSHQPTSVNTLKGHIVRANTDKPITQGVRST